MKISKLFEETLTVNCDFFENDDKSKGISINVDFNNNIDPQKLLEKLKKITNDIEYHIECENFATEDDWYVATYNINFNDISKEQAKQIIESINNF